MSKDEMKLRWLVRTLGRSHYRCEYRQDGSPRSTVKCAGCSHSSVSVAMAEQRVIDFVKKLLKGGE